MSWNSFNVGSLTLTLPNLSYRLSFNICDHFLNFSYKGWWRGKYWSQDLSSTAVWIEYKFQIVLGDTCLINFSMDFVSMKTIWLGIKINFIRSTSEIIFQMCLVWQSIFHQGYKVIYKKYEFLSVYNWCTMWRIFTKNIWHVFIKTITRY